MAVNTYTPTTTTGSTLTVTSGYMQVMPSTTSTVINSNAWTSISTQANIWKTPYEIPEDVARKLVDLIEQLARLDDSTELDAVAAGVAQEAECSKKEAKTTLVALRSLLSLASIERKLEAV